MATYTGNTVEEAIERGLRREGVARENSHIEIEQRESNGFLGLGRKRARVNIEPIHEETVRRADRMATRHVDQSNMEIEQAESAMEATLRLNKVIKAVREAGIQDDKSLTEEEKEEKIKEIKATVKSQEKESSQVVSVPKSDNRHSSKDIDEQRIIDTISNYLLQITEGMGIKAQISCKKLKNNLLFNLSSAQDALLIGKHGKILDSLETMAKAQASVLTVNHINVSVNVGDYREKREHYLVALAKRAAD
ncbi:MAG: Jag N-terminal domain-containing protein, partial [Lactovum sp.]